MKRFLDVQVNNLLLKYLFLFLECRLRTVLFVVQVDYLSRYNYTTVANPKMTVSQI